MIQLVTDIKEANCITHKGTMHADEVFASALLELLYDEIYLIRADEKELVNASEKAIIYDIGRGKFDHHQPNAKLRDNGIKYSSFGLLWQEFGKDLLKKLQIEAIDEVFSYVDHDFIVAIDAIDNGIFPKIDASYHIKTLSDVIKLFNPSYGSLETENDQFLKATLIAKEILLAEISSVYGKIKAKKIITKLMEKTEGPILELKEYIPYEETVLNIDKTGKFLFVVFPSNRGGYAAHTIPKSSLDHNSRVPFKKEWAGLTNQALQEKTGVKTAKFCHNNLFLVTAQTKEDVFALVNLCLNPLYKNE